MKAMQLSLLILLLTLLLLVPYTAARDYTHWNLPYGAKARLGKGTIRGLTYTPDGNHLLVASSIGIWTYDAHTMEEQNLFTMHTSHSMATAFSPDRQMFAGVSWDMDDNKVDLWDLTNRQHKETLKGQKYIKSIAFSPKEMQMSQCSCGTLTLENTQPHSLGIRVGSLQLSSAPMGKQSQPEVGMVQ